MTSETPEQQNCLCCHEPFKFLNDPDESSEEAYLKLNQGKWLFVLEGTEWDYYNDDGYETHAYSAEIKHCPECGRKLSDE
ncbi:hypothetical protein [Paucilactobacillus kaifaensis]|uniref:hypothetical protein n=1 Tax=Paucilactobacillus kaifaensis TaxID=2559921 RepID=UPI0010F5DDC8|nr:hypothetical protein [Paucilactobacillus kaifaensis]